MATAINTLNAIQKDSQQHTPEQVERMVADALKGLKVADVRAIQAAFLGVNVGRSKKAMIEAIVERIENVRASWDRTAEIMAL